MAINQHVEVVRKGRQAVRKHWDDKRTLKPFELSGANLRGARLFGCDLHDSILTRTDLTKAILAEANLSTALLGDAVLVEADLSDANLSYADLTGANLQGANLKGALLVGAIFANSDGSRAANLGDANLAGIQLTPEGEEGFGSFLDLACAEGIETAHFGTGRSRLDYVEQAFNYAHRTDIHERTATPGLVQAALERIRSLRQQYRSKSEPQELVQVVGLISKALLEHVARHPEELDNIRPRQFEELVAEILASFGWLVELTPETRDGGYDIFAVSKDIASGVQNHWIIECKKYRRDRKVGVDVVRSLYGVKKVMEGANAMLATTSDFSREAYDYKASRYDLDLRNYESILRWLEQISPASASGVIAPPRTLWLPGDPVDGQKLQRSPGPTIAAARTWPQEARLERSVPPPAQVSRYVQLLSELNRTVANQREAARALVCALEHSDLLQLQPNRPRAALFLHGPPGVGKSHFARQVARFLFLDERAVLALNMDEYREKYSFCRLVGPPAGYLGYEKGGVLTGPVYAKPGTVIALDSCEFAYPPMLAAHLTEILERGVLTETSGRTVNFTQAVLLVMSRNDPRDKTAKTQQVDQGEKDEGRERSPWFSPEILPLFDDVIKLNALEAGDLVAITKLQIEEVATRIQKRGIRLDVSSEAIDQLVGHVADDGQGAHALAKTIERLLIDPMAELITRFHDRGLNSIRARGGSSEGGLLLIPMFEEESH